MDNFPQWDTDLFLLLNSLHCVVMDYVMWIVSNKYTSVPLYLLLLYWLYRKYPERKSQILLLIAVGLTILLADQISSTILKPMFQRLRPTHSSDLIDLVHTVNGYRGGKYGFVSSHAANTFAIAIFVSRLLRNRNISVLLCAWAVIVSYSRIYLGVHYPLDILCGAIVGLCCGYFMVFLFQKADTWWRTT